MMIQFIGLKAEFIEHLFPLYTRGSKYSQNERSGMNPYVVT